MFVAHTSPPLDTTHALHDLAVLDATACARWRDGVLALRRQWTTRSPHAPFFTLGLAAYLDAIDVLPELQNKSLYQALPLRRQNNRFLREHFEPLLALTKAAIADFTQAPARFDDAGSALPGFHIHLPHTAFADAVASRHLDLQFQRVFPTVTPSAEDLMTFTLPISLPPQAGLRRWLGDDEREEQLAYQVGHLYLHSGLDPHQAILHPQASDTPRIALQGHGLRVDGAWILYW